MTQKKLSKRNLLISYLVLVCVSFFASCDDDIPSPAPNSSTVIKSFKLETGQVGSTVIDVYKHEINLTILSSLDLTAITPTIVAAQDAKIYPASGEKIDISSNLQYTYKVIAPSTREQEWLVKFRIANADSKIPDYGAYVVTNANNNKALGIQGDMLYNNKYWDKALVDVGELKDHVATKWQKWHFIFDSEENHIKYYKVRNLSSGLYMTVPDQKNSQGTKVCQDQLKTEETDLQLWRLNEKGDGWYEIINKKTELLLTLEKDENEQEITVLRPERENSNNQWHLQSIPLESYRDVEVQNFFRRNEPGMGSVAFDQGNSIPLTWGSNNGKILWITEDAWDSGEMLGPDVLRADRYFKYNNSILLQPSKDDWNPVHTTNLTNPHTKHPDRVFQMMDVQDGMGWTWPGTGVEIGDKVYVYAGEGQGLEAKGTALYILHQNEGTAWEVDRETPVNVGGPDGMVRAGDGYVYCYSNESGFLGYTSTVFVRRFKESNPLLDWEFWDGTGWTVDAEKKKAIADSKCTTNVAKFGNVYIMLSMDQGFFVTEERFIYLSYSSTPVGPWSEKVKVYEIEEYINGGKVRFYTPILHPYFTNDRKELLLTFCLNFAADENIETTYTDKNGNKAMNAYYYRLKAIRVPLSVLGL